MPDRDVVESQEITLSAILVQGEPKDKKVQFTLKYGEKEETKEAQLASPEGKPTEHVATLKWTTPAVPADQEKIELTYTVVHDKKELSPAEKIVIWPAAGKLTAVDALDSTGKTALKGFTYKVVQTIDGGPVPVELRANDKGLANFSLQPGAAFKLEAVTPFEIKETDDSAGKKPRDLKIKAWRVFTPKFDTPTVPDLTDIKQYVNQPRADDGTKGIGSRVLLRVMCKEDKDKTTGLIGGPGIFCYVRATFAGFDGKPSTRVESAADKKPQLIAGKELSDIKEDTSNPDQKGAYTAKLELKKGGKGELEVELGLCGGDICIVELGSTPEMKDNVQAIFTNWRKIFYEVLAPAGMPLPDKTIGAKTHKDLNALTIQRMNAQAVNAYVEWELLAGKTFPVTPQLKAACELPGTFNGRAEPTIFQLTDNQSEKILRATPRTAGSAPSARFILCDSNFYATNAFGGEGGPDNPIKLAVAATAKQVTLNLVSGGWLPISDHDGSKVVVRWTATHVKNLTTSGFEYGGDQVGDNGGTSKKKIVKVVATSDPGDKGVLVEFASPAIGNVATTLTSAEKQKVTTWMSSLLTLPKRRARAGDKLVLQCTGADGNDRRDVRIANVKAAIQEALDAAPKLDPHPGLDDAGNPLKGDLSPDAVVKLALSTFKKVVIELPDALPADPGKLAGAESATNCPISVTLLYHYHGNGLGTQYPGDLLGDLLVVNNPAGAVCSGDVILHEAGHLFGLSPLDIAKDAFAPGIDKCKAFNEADADWKFNGANGHLYEKHGHQGPHCAYGLTDAQKGEASYASTVPGTDAKCIMYGSTWSIDSQRGTRDLCPQCLHLMRARDYTRF
jgi:hypothetical protein